jgi:catechol 2,3-dioxygenase-like lactoylglutathione lyase family enzyme
MKRFHVHVSVQDIQQSVRFYATLFGVQPTVLKDDYAKWQLDDPRVNFAISSRAGRKQGIDHLGIQAENGGELEHIASRLAQAEVAVMPQKDASCCYTKSDKYWTIDPTGVPWESFHTLDSVPVYGEDRRSKVTDVKQSCCGPKVAA